MQIFKAQSWAKEDLDKTLWINIIWLHDKWIWNSIQNLLYSTNIQNRDNTWERVKSIKDNLLQSLEELDFNSITWEAILALWDELVKGWTLIDTIDYSNSTIDQLEFIINIEKPETKFKIFPSCNEELTRLINNAKVIIEALKNSKLNISWKQLIKYGRELNSIWIVMPLYEINVSSVI